MITRSKSFYVRHIYINMSNFIRHPYHLVDVSPWPLIRATGAFFLTSGLVIWFHLRVRVLIYIGLILILLVISQ